LKFAAKRNVLFEKRQTFVDCAPGRVIEHNRCGIAGARPAGDQAIFGVKDKLPIAEVDTVSV
jgi:hypothetical protein